MKRSEQEYDWMAGTFKPKVRPQLSPFFTRNPYAGTKAEVKGGSHDRNNRK